MRIAVSKDFPNALTGIEKCGKVFNQKKHDSPSGAALNWGIQRRQEKVRLNRMADLTGESNGLKLRKPVRFGEAIRNILWNCCVVLN